MKSGDLHREDEVRRPTHTRRSQGGNLRIVNSAGVGYKKTVLAFRYLSKFVDDFFVSHKAIEVTDYMNYN